MMSAPFSESDDDKKKDDEAHAGSNGHKHGHKHLLGAGGPPTFPPKKTPRRVAGSSGSTWRSTGRIMTAIAVIAAASAFGYQWGRPPATSVAELPTSATASRNLRDARSDDAPAL